MFQLAYFHVLIMHPAISVYHIWLLGSFWIIGVQKTIVCIKRYWFPSYEARIGIVLLFKSSSSEYV